MVCGSARDDATSRIQLMVRRVLFYLAGAVMLYFVGLLTLYVAQNRLLFLPPTLADAELEQIREDVGAQTIEIVADEEAFIHARTHTLAQRTASAAAAPPRRLE